MVNWKDKMCAEENVPRQKHLKQLLLMKWNFNLYIQGVILKPAKEGFQICPVQPRFQRGLREITQRWRARSGVSNALLQQHCNSTFFSILLFVFSAIKGPAKELRLSFILGEKYVNKIFLLFSGSEIAWISAISSSVWRHWAIMLSSDVTTRKPGSGSDCLPC